MGETDTQRSMCRAEVCRAEVCRAEMCRGEGNLGSREWERRGHTGLKEKLRCSCYR